MEGEVFADCSATTTTISSSSSCLWAARRRIARSAVAAVPADHLTSQSVQEQSYHIGKDTSSPIAVRTKNSSRTKRTRETTTSII